MQQRWQLGSEFHWTAAALQPPPRRPWLPKRHALFASATSALIYLIQQLQAAAGQALRLHLPSYYCMNVPQKLQSQLQQFPLEICWYQDLPSEPAPNWSSLQPEAGDLVLAVNFFGVRQAAPWQQWIEANPGVIVIEDHSHDIASPWATQSQADYCIASLYKTLPVPDGGLMWSPQGHAMPTLVAQPSTGTELRFAAMLLKQAYLNGAEFSAPRLGVHGLAGHRSLELQGIDVLEAEEPAPISVLTAQLLPYLNLQWFRQQRVQNVRQFIQAYRDAPHPDWQPLFETWPAGAVPFNGIIVCRTPTIRDQLRQYLIQHQIFPATHWPASPELNPGDPQADHLGQRILTLPLDQRYDAADVDRLMQIIQQYFRPTVQSVMPPVMLTSTP